MSICTGGRLLSIPTGVSISGTVRWLLGHVDLRPDGAAGSAHSNEKQTSIPEVQLAGEQDEAGVIEWSAGSRAKGLVPTRR
jgi:hypothetical protein